MASVSVANNPLGSYPVKVTKEGSGGSAVNIQHVIIDSTPAPNTLDVYSISDLDESTSTKYYGFLDKDGNWYILKLTTTAARYAKGTSSYATNWTNRASLTYDYYDTVF